MVPRRSQAAFTLIELSVVLVILGLLVGSVLVGQNLVESAKVRKIANQYREYQTAYNLFREKFECLPGDCPFMTRYMPDGCSSIATGNATCNGDGDGRIIGYEERYVCSQFNYAGLVKSDCYGGWGAPSGVQAGRNALPSAYNKNNLVELIYYAGTGIGWAPYFDHATVPGHILATLQNSPDGTYHPFGLESGGMGMEMGIGGPLDQKIDDGLPMTGKLMQYVPFCGNDTNNTYTGWYSTPNYKVCYSFYRID